MNTTRKKQNIMEKSFQRAEQRFEKPDGVTNKLFIWTMLTIVIIGLVVAWLEL